MAQNRTWEISPIFHKLFDFADKTSTIRLEDWLSLITLCFAPLLGHIVAGVPTVVRRSRTAPSWLDTMCLYNPTTILWRYLAIMDRRIRRRIWSPADMAASNAYFWTDHGWDGSEEMMWRSRLFCVRTPSRNRTEILSTDTLKTVITALQGIQAITVMVRGILGTSGIGNQSFGAILALDTIFYPLSSFGVLRLFAAPWLTEEYSFVERRAGNAFEENLVSHQTSYPPSTSEGEYSLISKPNTATDFSSGTFLTESVLEPPPESSDGAFRPAHDLRVIAARVSYLFAFCCLLAICICLMIPFKDAVLIPNIPSTNTLWLLGALYIFLSLVSISTLTFYLIRRGNSMTTVLPCARAWWYRIYTLMLLAASIAMIVLAGIYTRRAACGRFTVYPERYDNQICNGTPVRANGISSPFGFVSRQPSENSTGGLGALLSMPDILVFPLNGWCSGSLAGNPIQVVRAQ